MWDDTTVETSDSIWVASSSSGLRAADVGRSTRPRHLRSLTAHFRIASAIAIYDANFREGQSLLVTALCRDFCLPDCGDFPR